MTRSARRVPRRVLAAASVTLVLLGAACVDLFHGTDFETLCARSPDDPSCGNHDAGVPDVAEASTDAARPRPNFCAWSSDEARRQAVRACAWLGACEGPLGESLFGPCVVHAQLAFDCTLNPTLRPRGAVDAFWACLATAKTCGEVDQCVFPGGVENCGAAASGNVTACGTARNAGVRLACSDAGARAQRVEPCVLSGQTCTPENTSNSTCAGALGFACTTNACSGSSVVECRSVGARMVDRGHDCGGYGGGECTVFDAGPACAPGKAAKSCSKDTAPTCDGTYLVRSCLGGSEVTLACDALGLPCDTSEATTADPTAACVNRGPSACSGGDVCVTPTKLRSCGRGGAFEVECPEVGLGPCAIDVLGRGSCAAPPH
jgi:hypothetical protein